MTTYNQVDITPAIGDIGVHTLTIESYDDAGGVYSTLKTDTVSITVTEFVRDTTFDSTMIITRGDYATFDVEYIYSLGVFIPVAINLKQPTDGTELNWVSFDEITASGYTEVQVDTSLLSGSGKHVLTLHSFDTSGTYATSDILKTDYVTLYVTDYIRDADLVQTITMRQDTPRTYSVPHCYAELTELFDDLGYTVNINLRQQDGTELPWVTITEVAGQSDIYIDPTHTMADPVGIYVLFLESYDTNDPEPDPLQKPTLRTD